MEQTRQWAAVNVVTVTRCGWLHRTGGHEAAVATIESLGLFDEPDTQRRTRYRFLDVQVCAADCC